MRHLLCVWLFVGCVKPADVTMCGEFTCGLGAICSPDGTRCVAPETVSACNGLGDGDRCTYTGISDGVCTGGICVSGGCGNGIVETALGEACDDGNFISGDGCRGDCLSAEACGDGIQDLAAGELCDCGSAGMTVAGCSEPNSDAPNAECRTDCSPARCGDGITDAPNEACDDGNNEAGDGCRADCSGRWTQMTSNTFANLLGVWAASPTDAWAVGVNRIMRWNGSVWSSMPLMDNLSHTFKGVCGLSPTDVFVYETMAIHRWNGVTNTWSTSTTSTYNWSSIFCRGSDMWIGGRNPGNNSGAYAYWNGTNVAQGNSFDLDGDTEFWRSTDGEMFATDQSGILHHASANRVYWYAAGAPESPTPPSTGAFHVTGTTSTDITVTAGAAGAKHYSTAWTPIADSNDFSPKVITVVPGTSPTMTLHIGAIGGVVFCSPTACKASLTPTEQNLNGVWSLDEKHSFIVGDHGTILY